MMNNSIQEIEMKIAVIPGLRERGEK